MGLEEGEEQYDIKPRDENEVEVLRFSAYLEQSAGVAAANDADTTLSHWQQKTVARGAAAHPRKRATRRFLALAQDRSTARTPLQLDILALLRCCQLLPAAALLLKHEFGEGQKG